jgi:acyl-CoA-binding protein
MHQGVSFWNSVLKNPDSASKLSSETSSSTMKINELYGLFKQSKNGPAPASLIAIQTDNVKVNMVLQAQQEAWRKCGNMTEFNAKLNFISKLKTLHPEFSLPEREFLLC